MTKCGNVFNNEILCGKIYENDDGYCFEYEESYLESSSAEPVSLTLPLSNQKYVSKTLFPFFDGLIPEGWLLEVAIKNWKLNFRDRFSLLLTVCKDCIGSVSIEAISESEET